MCDSSIGYHARKVTLGPESDLVKAFLESGLEGKGYSFTSERMAIFIEPKIESGFPDVVIAKFKPGFYDQWPKARNLLTSNELRMLSFLYSCQGADYDKIRALMHLNSVSAANSIELLFDANLIDRNRDSAAATRAAKYIRAFCPNANYKFNDRTGRFSEGWTRIGRWNCPRLC